LRVLVVMSKFVAGGAETTALRLIDALQGKQGYEFVAVAVKGGGELAERIRRTGVETHDGIARFRGDPVGLWRMAGIIRRRRIDAVICVAAPRDALFYTAMAPPMACRCVPRICWCHSYPAGHAGNFVPTLRRYRKLGLIGPVVCISRSQRRALAAGGLGGRGLPVIRNGVDVESFTADPVDLGTEPGRKTIVQVANAVPDKDHATILQAAKCLRDERSDFQLVLVGRRTDWPEMISAIADAGLADTVIAAGYRQDVPGILASADLFVLSTHLEVSSVATLEAFAAGVPAVVSDIPAFDEMLVDGQEGLRVPPGDARAFADAMDKLLGDPQLASELTARARKRLKQYELPTMVRRFDRLLRCVTGHRKP